MDFHRTSNYLVTASDDESICLYDVANATCNQCRRSQHERFNTTVLCAILLILLGLSCLVCALEKNALSLALWIEQELLRVQGRPATAYDDQGLVFAVAFGGYIRMFDTWKYEKSPFDIFSVGGDMSEADVIEFSNDGRHASDDCRRA
ncbi:transducin/WD40 repeat-like superfamily protein [Actinidia rufa]|uniref:Transducin/WD40 repeat-like superfamily protein n=1 Tax=Actinidia rufa TaxID=165716 RepID=A0A7J0EPR0_9ERIC|nr:transducin/WD40 repeat-like superfamily protein [Actinidia rufa]